MIYLFICLSLNVTVFPPCSFQTLDQDKEYEVCIASGGTPDCFYVIKESSKGLLQALADDIVAEMAEKSETLADQETLTDGSPCLVLDDSTSKWVRGQVKTSGDVYKVSTGMTVRKLVCVCVCVRMHVCKCMRTRLYSCVCAVLY